VTDRRMFRLACYELARRTGATVSEFRFAEGATPNFDQGIVTYRGRTVAVVRARDSALFAIAEPRVVDPAGAGDAGPLTFVDEPVLAAALPDVRVLTKAELDAPFETTDWPDVLLSDIRYWKPATVGEALFNYWD
jgi:hypothetical protein